MKLSLNPSWQPFLNPEFDKPYMLSLLSFLTAEYAQKKSIFPPEKQIFNAFNLTPFDQVKVVIIGQDPYHGPSQSHGLCFSVPVGVGIPPSLKNIYKEIERDIGVSNYPNGCLQAWAEQGVLLLNATLTVEQGLAGSHQGKGWERFTDVAIRALNDNREGLVFLLWGAYAQKKGRWIDQEKHKVLVSSHPSPLSNYRGFSGCGHFSKVNDYLQKNGSTPIVW